MDIDIDVSALDAEASNRLRALFASAAAASRQAGYQAEEAFLVGIAGLLDSFVAHRVAKGDAPPTAIKLPAGPLVGVDTSDLSAGDCVLAGEVLLRAAETAYKAKREPLGDCFTELAGVAVTAGKGKV